jgi:hypothetical protein
MKKILTVAMVFLPLTAFSASFELNKSQYRGFPNTLHGRDFFTSRSNLPASFTTLKAESCRENISQVICLVDPALENQKPQDRKCLEGGKAYAVYFEQLYDNYPPAMQKMFCSLRYLFIEKQFFGTAYAGALRDDSKKLVGAMMGIRKSVLDEKLDLKTWASWKDQLNFGGVADSYHYSSELPVVDTTANNRANDFLYFVISHEFGHLFDFANDLNKTKNCPPPSASTLEDPECEMAEGSWGSISWITDKKIKPAHDFPLRTSLCFYTCNGKSLAKSDVTSVYQGIYPTSFISLYSTTEPWDDFADSLAYYLSRKNLQASYRIDTHQGDIFNITEKLDSAVFAEKYRYIDQFMNRADIVYP